MFNRERLSYTYHELESARNDVSHSLKKLQVVCNL